MQSCYDAYTMRACVLQVESGALLVRDMSNGQEVQVNTNQACYFSVCDHICIHYNGAMTASIPPQISAINIHRISGC